MGVYHGLIKAKCGISRVLIGVSDGRTTSDVGSRGRPDLSESRSSGTPPSIII